MTIDSRAREARLAAEPLRLAGPRPGFIRGTVQSLRDIAGQAELLRLLVRRELKARYKDSILGFFWSLAKPLAMLLVYYVAIGKFLGAEGHAALPGRPATGVPDFAVFIFTGLTAWQLFSDIIVGGTGSIVANAGLIKKVYLPREVFPLSVVGAALFNFAIQLTVLVGATIVIGKFPTGDRWWYFVLALAVLIVFSTALALLLAAINVYLRDVQYLIEIMIMILLWASPIIYTWKNVNGKLGSFLQNVYFANPMTQVVLGFQRAFWVGGDGEPFPANLARSLWITLGVSLIMIWLSQRVFARLQANFAQEL